MKVEVIRNGTFREIIDTEEERQPFIFKSKYYKPYSDENSIYCRDGSSKKFSKKKETVHISS
jgi:hypothetical protein